MKKVLLFVLVLTALKATAQVPTPTVMTESKNNSLFQTAKKSNLTIKRDAAEGWFDPAEASAAFNSFPLDFTSGNLNVNAIWADSAIYFAYTDGYNGPQTMGAGMIFDPRNPIYAGSPYNTTKYTTYIVDSIELNYLYTRKNMDVNVLDKVNFYSFKNLRISNVHPGGSGKAPTVVECCNESGNIIFHFFNLVFLFGSNNQIHQKQIS